MRLDLRSGRLRREEGALFDPARRRWLPPEGRERDALALAGEPVDALAALRWLQRDSGFPCRVPIGVIGPREPRPDQAEAAERLGALVAGLGLPLICGGRGGVMEAACRGAAGAGGIAIGILPDDSWEAANPHVTIPIATGIGVARNAIIARAALCLVAVGGGYGTLSEIGFGLQFGRPVMGLADAPAIEGVRHLATVEAAAPAIAAIVLGL